MVETKTETLWQKMARADFPWYDITGDGPLCVILACQRRIVLTNNPMVARATKDDCCGHGCCHEPHYSDWHRIRELKPPEPRRAFRKKIHIDEDE